MKMLTPEEKEAKYALSVDDEYLRGFIRSLIIPHIFSMDKLEISYRIQRDIFVTKNPKRMKTLKRFMRSYGWKIKIEDIDFWSQQVTIKPRKKK